MTKLRSSEFVNNPEVFLCVFKRAVSALGWPKIQAVTCPPVRRAERFSEPSEEALTVRVKHSREGSNCSDVFFPPIALPPLLLLLLGEEMGADPPVDGMRDRMPGPWRCSTNAPLCSPQRVFLQRRV